MLRNDKFRVTDTVLWFEFLLNPDLITKHLQKTSQDQALSMPAEPSPSELMMQFITMAPDPVLPPSAFDVGPDGEKIPLLGRTSPPLKGNGTTPMEEDGGDEGTMKISRKQLALKILALKVATWFRWNLDVLEKILSIQKQMFLLRDLCTVAFGKTVVMPLAEDFDNKITADGNERAARFALTLYHRWVLRLQLLKDIQVKAAARPATATNMFLPVEPLHQVLAPEIAPHRSLAYLEALCRSTEQFYVFTYDALIALNPSEESKRQNFEAMAPISRSELLAQIHFDLVNFYMYTKKYKLARASINECRRHYKLMKAEYGNSGGRPRPTQPYRDASAFAFCHIDEKELEGYLRACGVSAEEVTLLERCQMSQFKEYKDIVEILQLDNGKREIPLVTRRLLELNLEAAISKGKLKAPRTLEMQVAALNLVRSVFEAEKLFGNVNYFEKYAKLDNVNAVIDACSNVYPHLKSYDKFRLKAFLMKCVFKRRGYGKKFLDKLQNTEIFTRKELEDLRRQVLPRIPPNPLVVTQTEWVFKSTVRRVEFGALERQLINCTTAQNVRKLLATLAATTPANPLWTTNPSWEIPTPLKSFLMSMPPGYMLDYAYIMLGKAREMTAKKDFIAAVSILSALKSETQRSELSNGGPLFDKLAKLVSWEILFVQIQQCLEEWQRKTLDLQSLANRCKQCLNAMRNTDSVMPRIEIVECCAVMLLNLNDWSAVTFLDRRLPPLELPIAFALTYVDMEKMKGSKKICRDAWDVVLSMFLVVPSKRSANSGARSSPILAINHCFQPFLRRIRHQMLFSLVISLLGKIHNILRDDPNHDLGGEYMQLWPTNISNPLSYNVRSVSETLQSVLTQALKYYPKNTAWLKMRGDLELANGNNEAAMRFYVNALVTGTDYCTIPLPRSIADDYLIRKMIRACSNLGCHMQATVLCQFLDEIDYGIVFKNLTEKASNFMDAMDAYYSCIWDATLLEFIINLHAKRGEHSRKLEAIATMGTLELNANNNDEIKREAAAIRKARFLRALAKQYLS